MTVTPPLLSSYDVCRAAGITFRQLDYWVRTGLLTPSVRNPGGSGCPRRWSEADVYRARVIGLLMRWSAYGPGAGTKIARRVSWELADMPAGSGYLVIGAGGSLAWASDATELARACVEHGPGVWVLDLTAVELPAALTPQEAM